MYKNKAPAIKAMISSRNIGFIMAVYLPFPCTTRHLIIPQNYLQPIVVVPGNDDGQFLAASDAGKHGRSNGILKWLALWRANHTWGRHIE
jgi:hypothetical protein